MQGREKVDFTEEGSVESQRERLNIITSSQRSALTGCFLDFSISGEPSSHGLCKRRGTCRLNLWSPRPGQGIAEQDLDHPRNKQPSALRITMTIQKAVNFQSQVGYSGALQTSFMGDWLTLPSEKGEHVNKLRLSGWYFWGWSFAHLVPGEHAQFMISKVTAATSPGRQRWK